MLTEVLRHHHSFRGHNYNHSIFDNNRISDDNRVRILLFNLNRQRLTASLQWAYDDDHHNFGERLRNTLRPVRATAWQY